MSRFWISSTNIYLKQTAALVLITVLMLSELLISGLTTSVASGLTAAGDEIVSVQPNGSPGKGVAMNGATITPDGRYVAFLYHGNDLVPGLVTSSSNNYYVYDRQMHTTDLINLDSNGNVISADNAVTPPAISDDGRFILFQSIPNSFQDNFFYLRDRSLGTTILLNNDPSVRRNSAYVPLGTQRNMSGDASVITYYGIDNLTGTAGTYIYHRLNGLTTFLAGYALPQVSNDGRSVYVVQNSTGSLYRYDVESGATSYLLNKGAISYYVSPDGDHAAYVSGNVPQLIDFQTGNISYISSTKATFINSISADNRFVNYIDRDSGDLDTAVADLQTGQKIEYYVNFNTGTQLNSTGDLLVHINYTDGQVYVTHLQAENPDTTPPVVSSANFSTNPKSVNQTSDTLNAQVTDDLSSVASVEYYDPIQAAWLPMTVSGSTASVNVNTSSLSYPAGMYAFKIRATDVAGNISTPATINLDVYNPNGGYAAAHGTITPNSSTSDSGDALPSESGQNVKFNLDFTVKYQGSNSTVPTGSSIFTWGSNCNSPHNNCFGMNTDSFSWLMVSGDNAVFDGLATLAQGSQSLGSSYPVRLTVSSGAQTNSPSHFLLDIYTVGDSPDTAAPLYQASGDLTSGQIQIHQ